MKKPSKKLYALYDNQGYFVCARPTKLDLGCYMGYYPDNMEPRTALRRALKAGYKLVTYRREDAQ